ncbi:glycosyltransferase [Actinokineospora guangxiensis]|uniref:Glycosyltransferase n=1 Tax=Actinokineospora guangxiensis TaxID=1490288 RepID=A0ABW0EHT7_9PSEU
MTGGREAARLLRAAADVTAESAELSRLATGWDGALHFSAARSGVLAPVRLRAGTTAVEFGCGSGAITRVLGEAGVSVLGVEVDPELADAARQRCGDLPSVRITSTPADADRPADLVVVTGEAVSVAAAAAAVGDDGLLVWAATNRTGFHRLLGGAPARWTRSELSAELAAAGLVVQRFLHPYPDWTVPRVVVDEAAYGREDADELVDKLVRHPFAGMFGLADVPVPGRAAHRALLADGGARATAPALLVLAARRPSAVATATYPGLAWLLTRGRLPQWRRNRVLGDDLVLRALGDRGAEHEHPWLRQNRVDEDPLVPGKPLDTCLIDALARGDLDDVTALLRAWRGVCEQDARALGPDDVRHPYLPGVPGVPVLPADHLDVHPGNLISTPAGLRRIDLEWAAGGGVDRDLALLRALLEFSREVVADKLPTPWFGASPAEVTARLAGLVGLGGAARSRWTELVAAEAAFQEAVSGAPAEAIAEDIARTAAAVPGESAADVVGGLAELMADRAQRARLARDLAEATAWFADRERDLTDERDAAEEVARRDADRGALLEHELAMTRAELAVKDDRLGRAFAEVARTAAEAATAWRSAGVAEAAAVDAARSAADLDDRLARTEAELATLAGSRVVRTAARVLWPAARLARGVRDLAMAHPGEEPDGVLRRVSRTAPWAVPALVRRDYRAAAERDAGLRFDLPVPVGPVAVGSGQAVEFRGWVAHDAVPVREVDIAVGAHRVTGDRGHDRPDVAAALAAAGVRAPRGAGVVFRVLLPAVDTAVDLPVVLLVRLVDGTVLRRELGALRAVPRFEAAETAADWPGTGTRIAVCLAAYRPDRDFLSAQIQSIRNQDHPNWHCVICDDASGEAFVEEIREIVAGDDRFTVVANTDNVGFYRNFERALMCAPADADAIALCDQDDVWDPDKLSTLAKELDDPDVALAYSDMRLIDDEGSVIGSSFWGGRTNQWSHLDSLLMLNTMTGASMLVRASLVRDTVLPFPPGSPSAFHDQWVGSVALAHGSVRFVPRPLYSYRQHGANVTGRRDDRLDADLPGALGMLRWAATGSAPSGGVKAAELEAVAEYELARIAQFAAVLSARCDPADARTRRALRLLARADHELLPLLVAAAGVRLRRADETAGAEHRLVAAAVRKRLLRRSRLALGARTATP